MDNTILFIILGILVVAVVGLGLYVFYQHRRLNSNEIVQVPALPECNTFLQNLDWRRAVKHFSPGAIDYQPILKAIQNAPSSFGLQPYKVIILTNAALKKDIQPFCFNQPQITECEVLLVFCAIKNVEARAEEFITTSGNDGMRDMITGFIQNIPDKVEWAKKQAYLALGFALAAATELKIASCPMEGFMQDKVIEILAPDPNYIPCVFLALGRENTGDKLQPKFRFPTDNLFHLED